MADRSFLFYRTGLVRRSLYHPAWRLRAFFNRRGPDGAGGKKPLIKYEDMA